MKTKMLLVPLVMSCGPSALEQRLDAMTAQLATTNQELVRLKRAQAAAPTPNTVVPLPAAATMPGPMPFVEAYVGEVPPGFGASSTSITVRNIAQLRAEGSGPRQWKCWMAMEFRGRPVVFVRPGESGAQRLFPPVVPEVVEGGRVGQISLLPPGETARFLKGPFGERDSWRAICYERTVYGVDGHAVVKAVGEARGDGWNVRVIPFDEFAYADITGEVAR